MNMLSEMSCPYLIHVGCKCAMDMAKTVLNTSCSVSYKNKNKYCVIYVPCRWSERKKKKRVNWSRKKISISKLVIFYIPS